MHNQQGGATQPARVYVGTYTEASYKGRGQGIYVFTVDTSTGALTPQQTVTGIPNPSFLAFDASGHAMYAVNELAAGGVSAFAVDEAGDLTYRNRQPSQGADPCHLIVDPANRYVLAANYTSGSVPVLPIAADGTLGASTDFVQNAGSGPHARQAGPHAHMVVFDPTGRYLLVLDLGMDAALIFRLDTDTGKLIPNDAGAPVVQLPPGTGPRHLAFHPDGRRVYILGEIGLTITMAEWDAAHGSLTLVQTISTVPTGVSGGSTAEIFVHPSGKFVYSSNRGHDSIAIFAVNAADGTLSVVGHEPTGGRTPRSFALDATGALLLVANQDSDTIVPFRIDQTTGHLTPTGATTTVPTPVCVLFR